ncbi:MAG: hypothetical protein JW944_14670, partial [Deltaproteobacteria bacterium]|nr:hypothetical protein [Deltaproteobacteria bacterium]
FMNSPVSVDVELNYDVDAIYLGDAYMDTSEDPDEWKGKLYKVAVPWSIVDEVAVYSKIPNNITSPWTFVTLFNAEKPITSSCALSMDGIGNMWVFVGSGRYFNNDDKINTDKQYMFGIKDPFYNKQMYESTYYHKFTASRDPDTFNLLNSDPYLILDDESIYLDDDNDGVMDWESEYDSGNYFGTWKELLNGNETDFDGARKMDGWRRSLIIERERIITKFAILGGMVFTPSFVPNADICGYGGESYLYGQYYETGTAHPDVGLDENEMEDIVKQMMDKISLGLGMASSVGLHVNLDGFPDDDDDDDDDSDATGFIQDSSGTIDEIGLDTAFEIKSGLRSWRER